MKFSVLIPTRNRLEYLRHAVESVLRQDYTDWELIISDNSSDEDIPGYLNEIANPRIKYFRTSEFIPVTDNWNNALAHSSGDYILMLGDDDGLLPGYFSTILRTLRSFPSPDFIYTSAYFYAYPGVFPEKPAGFLRKDQNQVFLEQHTFWLDSNRAKYITKQFMNFRMPVASNMQFSLISRALIQSMSASGEFFQSPFPDFYATPAMFSVAKRILIVPTPLVIIGITPKSYGYFHFNNRTIEGVKFLNNDRNISECSTKKLLSIFLPGTSYYDSWLLAAESLYTNFGKKFGMSPNYSRYRFLQIVHSYKKCYYDKTLSKIELKGLVDRMNVLEKLYFSVSLPLAFSLLGMVPVDTREYFILLLRRFIGQHTIPEELIIKEQPKNLSEVYQSFDI